ncbi:MAG: hypothetical protein OXC95_09825 [Dehalococcoidia bacterium]|nr:hypothetical protein [Dehalococcoidia bacterium]
MLKIISWNIARRHTAWRCLPDSDADIALLQEAGMPPDDVAARIDVAPVLFLDENGHRISRSAIAKLSDRARIEWLTPTPLNRPDAGDFVVSHPNSISAAIVTPPKGEPFTVVSFAAEYESPYRSSWNITDASLHRIISDLSLFIGRQRGHRVIAAGDLSVYHGYGEDTSGYWKGRYATVFDRMAAIGMPFAGPQHPNGRQTDPWPEWLSRDSLNVPTYRHSSGTEHQLDFVFASESMADSVQVSALNYPDDWGPSDHCRIEILVEP